MAKRIVTKIGYVFCIEVDDQYKCYFQYVANDLAQLNSSVIRVFKTHYPMDYVPDIEAIVNDEVYFYAHTVLKFGIQEGAWYKVGKSKNIGNVEDIWFRIFGDLNFSKIDKSENWDIWKINHDFIFIGRLTDEYRSLDMGFVYSYDNIVAKIRTGKFLLREML